ncbi:MAG: hypothetical protein QOC66_1684 [Pseudonocardiales bacterium]|jgi:hypothetical protein|nr:hypothetical protein [Pseudonocardiales bacterium]
MLAAESTVILLLVSNLGRVFLERVATARVRVRPISRGDLPVGSLKT